MTLPTADFYTWQSLRLINSRPVHFLTAKGAKIFAMSAKVFRISMIKIQLCLTALYLMHHRLFQQTLSIDAKLW